MEAILDKIIKEKEKRLPSLKEEAKNINDEVMKKISFLNVLEQSDDVVIIGEFKRASPSKGDINICNPEDKIPYYETAGCGCVSILTEEKFFKGNFSDLKRGRELIDIPILCKDFIIDKCQIDLAKANGANVILLIFKILDDYKFKELYEYAISKGLEVLCETADEKEVERALKFNVPIIGINNRNLNNFNVSFEKLERLVKHAKSGGAYIVSESGVKTSEDIEKIRELGCNAVLIGETFMRSENVVETINNIRGY